MLRLNFIFIALSSGLVGCATSQLNLFTNPPQAKMYVKPLGSGQRVLIGETPLTASADKIQSSTQSSGPFLVEFEKEGYETKSLVLSDLKVNNLLLNIELSPSSGVADQTTMNWMVEKSFEVQRLAKAQRHDEAMRLLLEMKTVAPRVATTYEMIGGIQYIKKQYEQSFDSFQEALRLNPKSIDALKMTGLLKEMVKSRTPAMQSLPEVDQ